MSNKHRDVGGAWSPPRSLDARRTRNGRVVITSKEKESKQGHIAGGVPLACHSAPVMKMPMLKGGVRMHYEAGGVVCLR